jgi:hypothetical protein
MKKDRGQYFETKSGLFGYTKNLDDLINGKQVVYSEKDGKEYKLLCDPNSLKIIGFKD